jgi:hypothetical protein
MRDDFLGKPSLNAVLSWFLGGSTQWLSTGSAGEPINWGLDSQHDTRIGQTKSKERVTRKKARASTMAKRKRKRKKKYLSPKEIQAKLMRLPAR